MRIMRYWQTIHPLPGVTVALVPEQTITDKMAFFDEVCAAVQMDPAFRYVLSDQTETVMQHRQSKS